MYKPWFLLFEDRSCCQISLNSKEGWHKLQRQVHIHAWHWVIFYMIKIPSMTLLCTKFNMWHYIHVACSLQDLGDCYAALPLVHKSILEPCNCNVTGQYWKHFREWIGLFYLIKVWQDREYKLGTCLFFVRVVSYFVREVFLSVACGLTTLNGTYVECTASRRRQMSKLVWSWVVWRPVLSNWCITFAVARA